MSYFCENCGRILHHLGPRGSCSAAQCDARFVHPTEEVVEGTVPEAAFPGTDVVISVEGQERHRLPVRGSVTMGRSARGSRAPDVVVSSDDAMSQFVSRIHVEIWHPTVGEVVIRDCDSTNGTFDGNGNQILDELSVALEKLPLVLHLGSANGMTVTIHRPRPEPVHLDFESPHVPSTVP